MRKITILKQLLLAHISGDIVELVDLVIGGFAELFLHLLEHPLLFFQLLLVDVVSLLVLQLPLNTALLLMPLEHLVEVDVINRSEAFDLLSEELVLGGKVQGIVDGIDEDAKFNQFFLDLLDLVYEGHHLGFFFGEDVELYEDYPKVEELVLFLTVFYAL